MNSVLNLTALAVTALFAQAAAAQSTGSTTQQSSSSGTPPTSMQKSQIGSAQQDRQRAQAGSSQQERQQAQGAMSQGDRQQARESGGLRDRQQAQSGATSQQQQQGGQSAPTAQGGPAVGGQTMSVSGTIESIDESKRSLTLKTEQGETVRMMIGPSMQNFNQLSKGDKVTARYTEAIVVALAEGGDANTRRQIEETVARQAQQGRPGMTVAQRNTIVANVSKIDKEQGTLTLRGPQGMPTQVKVEDQQALANIEQGDQIVISYIDATALSVEPSGSGSGGSGSTAAAGSGSSSRGSTTSPTSPSSGTTSGSKG